MNLSNESVYTFSSGSGSLQPSLTLGLGAKAKELKSQGVDVLSLAAGEPDFDTPAHIKEAAERALEAGETKYTPSSGRPDLRQAIADKLGRDNGITCTAAQVVASPGAKFSLFAALAVLCRSGDEVLIPSPYWLSYPEMVKAAGGVSVFVPTVAEEGFRATVKSLEEQVTERTRFLILNSPGNPTGGVYSRARLEAIAEFAVERNLLVIADEIYEKLVYNDGGQHCSIASLGPEIGARTVTVNGFSKAYSMTGWRLGYLSAPLPIADRIGAFQSHATSNPTSFVQSGGLAALQGTEESVERMRGAFEERREKIYNLLTQIPGINVHKPEGAFYIFPDISSFGIDSMTFAERLLEEAKLSVIPGFAFGADRHIRLSYAYDIPTIERGIERLAEFCAGLGNS